MTVPLQLSNAAGQTSRQPIMTLKTKGRTKNSSMRSAGPGDERGFSLLEMLIVIAMIAVVTAFAFMRIAEAQRAMRLTNATRQFTSYLEKARLDSIRRHADEVVQMATVTINSANSYSVTIDSNNDGALDPPFTINIPPQDGVLFNGIAFPTTIRFNWRGRTVDSSKNLIDLVSFDLKDSYGRSGGLIKVTASGDTSINANANITSVSASNVSPSMRPRTGIP